MEYDRPLFYHVMAYAAEADRDVIDMVSGNPDWEPPVALREGLRAYADASPEELQYPPSEGLAALREEIATRRGVDVERVVITNGAGQANHLTMAGGLEAHSGDTVLLTDPTYPYYPSRVELLGGEVRRMPVDDDGRLPPETVVEAMDDDVAVVVANSPNNPTGAVYPAETVAALAETAADHDALFVSDEVYDHFDYSGRFESALAHDSPHVAVSNSFSKSMAVTGLRVGYAILPERLVPRARTRHMLTNVAVSRPAQAAVLRALRETDPDYYAANRERLRERIATFTDALDAAGAAYTTPEGAFYVMARFEGFDGTLANTKRLIDEAGVAGMPGETFGDARDDWFRFALVTPRVEAAAARLAAFFG